MQHFWGHTHTKRDRRDSGIEDRGVLTDRTGVLEPEPGVLEHEPGLAAEVTTAGGERSAPTHTGIAELAYSYWEARGCQGGSPWEDWFRAERELKAREL